MIGAYMAMSDPAGYMVGSLFAFMMLSQRVAQPLVGMARLVEDYEEVAAAIGEVGSVLNRPLETVAGAVGLRPRLSGAISFQDVTFTYPATKTPALDRMSFQIPSGTMLGVVGRSGSGKSTIARLLQGINRDYSGFLKIDGSDLREIDLRHLQAKPRRRAAGQFPVPRLDPRQHHRRAPGTDAGRRGAGGPARRRGRIHRAHAQWLRNLYRGRLAQPFRRTKAAAGHRAGADPRSAHPDPR